MKYKLKSSCLDLFELFGKTLNIHYTRINKLIIDKLISNISE